MFATDPLRFFVVAGSMFLWAGGIALAESPEERFAAFSPEQSRAFEIEVMEKIADLALIPPVLNTSPLPKYDYDQLDYGMTIGIARTPGGRLWACWVAGEDGPKAFFVCAISDDDGVTWSKPVLVIDGQSSRLPMSRSVLVGNLWTDPLGRLWIFFNQSMMQFDGRSGVWAAICENPDAEKPVWSAPRRIWHGFTLNKPTVLKNGDWLLPVSLNREGFGPFKGAFAELDPIRGANVSRSSDQGATWERLGRVAFPNPDWDEHMMVERGDGSLWMMARTGKGPMQSVSQDGGKTWAEPSFPEGIAHPVARFHLRKLASGRVLLVKHGATIDTQQGRSQLSAWLSEDDGKSWKGGLMLDERTGVSYPDGFQSPDGTIYISYDRNRSTDGEILMARFAEEDVLAGKLVGPRSRLKMLISRPLGHKSTESKPVAFRGPTPGTPREITIPTVDLSGDAKRQVVVARGTPEVYQGHCDTVLMADGRTMFATWCLDHAGRLGPLARSDDGGLTWSDPLPVPDDWAEVRQTTPVIHRLTDPKGVERLVVFGGCDFPGNLRRSVSEDGGKTWSPMVETGLVGEVAPKTILPFDEGRRLVMWSDRRDPKNAKDPNPVVWQSESFDGGLTWKKERVILTVPGQWAQPCVVPSPDGKRLFMLLRENTRQYQSLCSFSGDEAKTWNEPLELPAALTGDRHVAKYAPDGRLVIAFRDRARTSATYGHYVAWVGQFEDLIHRREGQYRIKLLHNANRTGSEPLGTGNFDTGYSDLELLPDGTLVATTYVKLTAGPEKNSVVSVRFRLEETDALLAKKSDR